MVKLTVPLLQPLAVTTKGVPAQTVPLLVSAYVGAVGALILLLTVAVAEAVHPLTLLTITV